MDIAITKISPNGQVVIPAEVRKAAGIKPSTKFLVLQENGVVLLKPLNREQFGEDLALIEKIARAEAQIRRGEYITVPSGATAEEIDRALMGAKWSSSTARSSAKSTRKSRARRRG